MKLDTFAKALKLFPETTFIYMTQLGKPRYGIDDRTIFIGPISDFFKQLDDLGPERDVDRCEIINDCIWIYAYDYLPYIRRK